MKIILIGKGGMAGVVRDAIIRANKFEISHQIDENDDNGQIIGDPDYFAFIAIGNNEVRERISKTLYNFKLNVVHPSADCRFTTEHPFPTGCYFGANSVVGNNSQVGDFCIINTGVILEHDSVVGDYTHLAPGVVTGGRVKIGSRTFIGLGAIIRDGITIGNDCTVGMGSVITKDLPDNCTAYGNPARIIERKLQTMEWKK